MSLESRFKNIAHTGNSVTIEFYASGIGWEAGLNESFAIDNLGVTLNTSSGAVKIFDTNFDSGSLPNGQMVPGYRVSPGVVTANRTYSVSAATVVPVGNAIVDTSLDTANGGLFVGDALTSVGHLSSWTLYSGVFDGSRSLTPIIFRQLASNRFQIVGIGRTRAIAPGAQQTFDFDLQSGSDLTGPGLFFGWKDGGMDEDNAGVVQFDNSGPGTARFLRSDAGAANVVRAGRNFTVASQNVFARTYSIQATTTPLVGNPLINRTLTDLSTGNVYLGPAFSDPGRLNDWTISTGNDADGHVITPIIFKQNRDGGYDITGIGASRTVRALDTERFYFELQSGSDSVGPGYYLGWVDGNVVGGVVTPASGNAGSIIYTVSDAQTTRLLGAGTSIAKGTHFDAGAAAGRAYSIKASVAQVVGPVSIPGPLERVVYRFDLASPLLHTIGSGSTGVDISSDRNPQVHDAGSVEDTTANAGLSTPQDIGDVNGDGIADMLVSGNAGSYILFGPVHLTGVNNVADQAELVIDSSLGKPAGTFGDINGDGVNDLIFVRAGLGADLNKTFVTVIFTQVGSAPALHFSLPRFLSTVWTNDSRNAAQVRNITINSPVFSLPGASVHALKWHSPTFADLLVMAPAEQFSGVTGYIYSGSDIVANNGATWTTIQYDSDSLNPQGVATQLNYAGVTVGHSSEIQARVVGDVNGDGLEDIVITNPNFLTFNGGGASSGGGTNTNILPPVGRAYLLLGRTANAAMALKSSAAAILQGVSFAGGAFALGDVNHDGYDDFAISGSREASETSGGLFIYFGRAQFPNPNTPLSPTDATIVVTRDSADTFASGLAYEGVLSATAGDFNGDGRIDLLITEPSRIIRAAGSGAILDQDDRGAAYIFFSIALKVGGANLQLTKADVTLRGDAEFDNFGALPEAPRIDLSGDGLDDLIIGAPGANGFVNGLRPHAGKVYVIYGSAPKPQLPSSDQIVDLINRTITGSGSFIVDNGTGRPENFDSVTTPDINSDGHNDFILMPGEVEHWFRFTTLGDGQPGNAIRLTPAAEAGLLSILPADFGSIQNLEVKPGSPVNVSSGRVAIIEFDLSRFLAQLSDPAALDQIRLILSSPAVSSVAAPVQVSGFYNATDRVYFSGSDNHGVELWASLGNASDTYLVKDINPGAASSFPNSFIQVGTAVYFVANDTQLWKTDGTADGTVQVRAFNSHPQQLTVVGTNLYFVAADPAGGALKLWLANTSGVTALGVVFSPSNLTSVNNATLFYVDNESSVSGVRRIWQTTGGAPALVASQTLFDTPTELIDAGGILAFAARTATVGSVDREVFSYSGGIFRRLTDDGSPTTFNSNPTGLTYSNGFVFFASEDAPAGTTFDTTTPAKQGRELWAVKSDGSANAVRFNIAGLSSQDFAARQASYTSWRVVTDYINIFGTQLPIGFHLESFQVNYLIPGFVTSSSPSDFVAASNGVYFTADNGVNGRELWFSNGSSVSLVADVRGGALGSNPTNLTVVGSKLFFSADDGSGRGLWVYDGTRASKITKVDAAPTQLEARGGTLFFEAGGKMWVSGGAADGNDTARMDVIQPSPITMKISVLSGEGDDRVTGSDATRAATKIFDDTKIPGQGGEFALDISDVVRAALRDGKTRLTLRIENSASAPADSLNMLIATAGQPGGTRLEVTPRASNGVLADLISEDGVVVARGKAAIDMRSLAAGTYYLRVYNPAAGTQVNPIPFGVTIGAPIQGATHATADNDIIRGGDGDDLLMGNQGLDRIFGGSGNDRFIAEDIEVRDRAAGESLIAPDSVEPHSDAKLPSPNPSIDKLIADPNLLIGIVQGLGLPITRRYDGQPLAHDSLHAGDLAELITLDLNSLNISDLSGLEFATNLTTLNLANNHISPSALLTFLPGLAQGQKYFDAGVSGAQIGMKSLQHLAIDFNPIGDLQTIGQITTLRSLSIDSVPVQNLNALSQLTNLQVLSADGGNSEKGLVGHYYLLPFGAFYGIDPNPDNQGFFAFDYGLIGNGFWAPLVHTRTDATVNVDPNVTPFGGFADLVNAIAVVWTGSINITTAGDYTFYLNSDDASRLFVDGVRVVNNPGAHGMTKVNGLRNLGVGYHDIRIDYENSGGPGGITFTYSGPGFGEKLVPDTALLPTGSSPGVTNVDGIANLTGLRLLSLSNNQLATTSALSRLTSLHSLDLSNNQLTSIAPLTGLNALETIHLDNNAITSLDPLVGAVVIDNGDSGYAENGSWSHNVKPTNALQTFESDYSFHEAAGDGSYAEWTFSGLVPGVQYAVQATWPAMPDSGSKSAVFTFTSLLVIPIINLQIQVPVSGPAVVDQTLAPTGDNYASRPWQTIATVADRGNGVITVRLNTNATGGIVAADGVRLVRVNPTGANLTYVSVRGNPLNDRAYNQVKASLSVAHADMQFIDDGNAAPTITTPASLGSYSQGLLFDGINDFARTGNLRGLIASNPRETVEFWFNASQAGVLVSELGQTTPDGWNVSLAEILATGEIRVRTSNTPTSISGGTVAFGTWHHLALVYAPSVVAVYLDGALQGSANPSFAHPQSSGLGIYYGFGAGVTNGLSGAPAAGFKGMIDDLRVWNIVRSTPEIAANYARSIPGNDGGLINYLRFEGNIATTLVDSSNRRILGALGAAPTAPVPVTGVDIPNFAIQISASDPNGDPLTYSVTSSNPNVAVQMVGSRLLIDPVAGFTGVATITVSVTDFNNALHDPRNRRATMSFDVSIRANSIYGVRFWDANGDNVQNGGERGVDGHLVFVDGNGNGTYDAGEVSAYTDINGNFALRDIRLRSSPGGKAVVSAPNSTDPLGGMTPTTTSEPAPFDHIDNITRTDITMTFDVAENQLFFTNHYAGGFNITPEMTAGFTSVAQLASLINSRINATALAGHLFVQLFGNTLGFVTRSGLFIVGLTMQTYSHTVVTRTTVFADGTSSSVVVQDFTTAGAAGLPGSFSQTVTSVPVQVIGVPTAPDGGARQTKTVDLPPYLRRDTTTTSTVTFRFTVDNLLIGSISLNSAAVAQNQSLADLLADINSALTAAGLSDRVVASLDNGHFKFSTVQAGATKSLTVDASQHFVAIRTTTRLDKTTFDETVSDVTIGGGFGFAQGATATGSDQPQTSLDVYGAPRSDWTPNVAGDHLTPTVHGPGEVTILNFFGQQAIDRNALQAIVTSSGWTSQFAANAFNASQGVINFVAPGVSAPVQTLPWINLDRITITLPPVLAEAVRRLGIAPLVSGLTVTNLTGATMNFAAQFDSASNALVLTMTAPLARDFYTVRLTGAASAALGIVASGDAVLQFAVQPGDLNADGRTNDLDYYQDWNYTRISSGQNLRGDLNGDGLWDNADLAIIKANYQNVNPAAPALPKKSISFIWVSAAPITSFTIAAAPLLDAADVLKTAAESAILITQAPDLSVVAKADLSSPAQ